MMKDRTTNIRVKRNHRDLTPNKRMFLDRKSTIRRSIWLKLSMMKNDQICPHHKKRDRWSRIVHVVKESHTNAKSLNVRFWVCAQLACSID